MSLYHLNSLHVVFVRFKRSLLGVTKSLSHAQMVSFRGKFKISDEHPRLFHMGVPPAPRATIILPHAKLKKWFSYLNLLITFMMYGQNNETGCIIINLKFWAGKLAKSANYPGSYFQKLEWKLCSYKLRIMPRNFSHRLFPFFSSVFHFCFTCLFVCFQIYLRQHLFR